MRKVVLLFLVCFCFFWFFFSLSILCVVFSDPIPAYLCNQNITMLKVLCPISQNGDFYSEDASSCNKSWFQISFESVNPFWYIKRLHIIAIAYTLLYHIFINIFQRIHFSTVKFTIGNGKNMSFLLLPKSQKVWKKNLKQLDRAPLIIRDHTCRPPLNS